MPVRKHSLENCENVVFANQDSPLNHPKSQYVRPNKQDNFAKLDDFELLAVLGRGAFGKVMLVQQKETNSLFAMKALKKEFIVQNDDVESLKLEKRVFQVASKANHPFLVNIQSCFQTETRVYFVMEYVKGGDLMAHMMAQKRFPPLRVKFYACQVLLALDYLHKCNIVYRFSSST